MNISGIFLVLIATYLIYKIHTDTDQTGGDLKQMDISNRYQDPYYTRQFRELDDVDNVLNRPLEATNKDIARLVASNTFGGAGKPNIGDHPEIRSTPKTYLDFMDIMNKETPKEVKVLIESKQPYFLDEALIIERDGHKYYWDWRYPKQPISLDFAKDPERYTQLHPNEYPSYVIASRNYNGLQPNSDNQWV